MSNVYVVQDSKGSLCIRSQLQTKPSVHDRRRKENSSRDWYESCDERTKGDGIPPNIERSEFEKSVLMSTSKFLLNDTNEDDDRMSNITDIVCENDDERFRKLYNLQGHYSAIQSVTSVFSRVSYHDPTNFF
jgi:hypothetical protein